MITSFATLEAQLNDEVLERAEEVHTALLALISRSHHFQIGPPGTAKSLLVNRIAEKIDGLPEDGYFHYLLTQFTVPGELYGPPNLQDMRDKGIYRLNTARKLPRAYIAFLDEIFKGNSSILNANLTIMNERKFNNSTDDPNIPLFTMFAASNEMPSGDNLNALWDRLHFRHEVQPLQETSSFIKMLKQPSFPVGYTITLDDILTAQREAAALPISNNCYEAIKHLRETMRKEGIEPTERRWMNCMPIIKAEAWINGREVADVDCMRPLMHVLWDQLKDQGIVSRLILEIANPLDKEAQALLEKLLNMKRELTDNLNSKEKPDAKTVQKLGVEAHYKLDAAEKDYKTLEDKMQKDGVTSPVMPRVKQQMKEITEFLVTNIFGFDTKTRQQKF